MNNNFKAKKCIYKITNPNGKIYIGQTINLQKRVSRYRKKSCKSQKRLYNSLVKYGFESHKIEILYICDDINILNDVEIFYIRKYNSFNDGLNLTSGGKFLFNFNEETRNKLRIQATGNKNRLGHVNKWGRHSDESKKLMSDIVKKRFQENGSHWKGRKQTDEHIRKIAEAKYKLIVKCDLDGNFIYEYNSLKEASNITGISKSNISECCNNKRKSAGGFKWYYK